MSKTLIFFMRVVLDLAAFVVVAGGVIQGELVATVLGLGDASGLVHAIAGFMAGASVASVLFGMPIVLLSIDRKASDIAEIMVKIEKNTRQPGFADSGNAGHGSHG